MACPGKWQHGPKPWLNFDPHPFESIWKRGICPCLHGRVTAGCLSCATNPGQHMFLPPESTLHSCRRRTVATKSLILFAKHRFGHVHSQASSKPSFALSKEFGNLLAKMIGVICLLVWLINCKPLGFAYRIMRSRFVCPSLLPLLRVFAPRLSFLFSASFTANRKAPCSRPNASSRTHQVSFSCGGLPSSTASCG